MSISTAVGGIRYHRREPISEAMEHTVAVIDSSAPLFVAIRQAVLLGNRLQITKQSPIIRFPDRIGTVLVIIRNHT